MDDTKTSEWLVWTIRSEMVRHRLTYAHLVELLQQIGIEENERNLRNKVKRGTFSATFYVHCMIALGVKSLPLDDPKLTGRLSLGPVEDRITRAPPDNRSADEIIAEVERRLAEPD